MKIGVVCYPTYGGSGVIATELGIQLAKKGHEIHFITYSQPVRLDILYRPAVTFSINKSDVVTSVSESLKKDTLSSFVIKNEIEVIPNFIDIDLYQVEEECNRAQIAPNNERIVIHISNMRELKRIPDVISIFHRIRRCHIINAR